MLRGVTVVSLLVLVSGFTACGSERAGAVRGDAGPSLEALDGAMREEAPVTILRCTAGDGARTIRHDVRLFSGGGVSTTCAVEGGDTSLHGAASYEWGRAGQPEALCVVHEGTGGLWRFSLVQSKEHSIATHVSGGSDPRWREWLLKCRSVHEEADAVQGEVRTR